MKELEVIALLKENRGGLSHLAFNEAKSRGRKNKADSDSWMYELVEPFIIDQQKIELSKAWRRLAYKTQVFSLQFNPHVRTRLSHTQEVISIAALGAYILGLNVDLCVSIAKAHDVGHLPFGHVGERFMSHVTGNNFDHAAYGAVVLQEIERGGEANFSFETLEGVIYHSGKAIPETKPEEYKLVYWADKIAYVSHDINDAVRKGFLGALPKKIILFGATQRERIKRCLLALLVESIETGRISFDHSFQARLFRAVREWLFENVYRKIDDAPCFNMLDAVYSFLERESRKEGSIFFGLDPAILLSLTTDWECWRFYQSLISNSQNPAADLGVSEIVSSLRGKKIDLKKPDFSFADN